MAPTASSNELLILAALADRRREQYGLEIVETIAHLTEGKRAIPLGGLYTTLHRMEKKGLITGRWGQEAEGRRGARRRYYEITGLGESAMTSTGSLLALPLRLLAADGN